jgi:hypothetical protein
LYSQLFATIAIEAPDLLSAVHDFFTGAAETLRETDYADACPIATAAVGCSGRLPSCLLELNCLPQLHFIVTIRIYSTHLHFDDGIV